MRNFLVKNVRIYVSFFGKSYYAFKNLHLGKVWLFDVIPVIASICYSQSLPLPVQSYPTRRG